MEEVIVEEVVSGWRWDRRDGSIYHFDPSGRLEKIIRNGTEVSLVYDAEIRLITVQDSSTGRQLDFQYNVQGFLEKIVGPATSAVPSGVWVTFGYDANQNTISVTYADGSGFDYAYGDPNDAHNVTEKKDKSGHLIASWAYDEGDRTVHNYSRDGRGGSIDYIAYNEAEYTDAYGNTRVYKVRTRKGYQLFSQIEGEGQCPSCGSQVVRKEYDSDLRVAEIEYVNGRIDQYTDFDANGNAGTVIRGSGSNDEKVIVSVYHPDRRAKLMESRPSVLGEGDKVTIWDYDDDGNDVPNENPTQLLHRQIERGCTVDSSGNTIPYQYVTAYAYNINGQVTSLDGPQPGSGDTTTFSYDPATGDLLSTTRPHVGTTTFAYDGAGQVVRVTDPNGNSSTYAYDGRGRLRSILQEPDGGTTTYEYNVMGVLASITDPDGVTYHLTYDPVSGLLSQIVDPSGNYIAYAYDDQGNRTEAAIYRENGDRVFWKRYDYQGGSAPGKLGRVI